MNAKITLVELVDLMAASTSTSKRLCDLFVRELFATVSQALIDGESVKVKGIGTFKVTAVKSRKSVDVSTGLPVQLRGYNKVTFTPDKNLAESINQPFAQFEAVVLDDAVTDEKLAAIDKQFPSTMYQPQDAPEDATAAKQETSPEKKEKEKEEKPIEEEMILREDHHQESFFEPEELFPDSEPDEFFVPEPLGHVLPQQPEEPEPVKEPEPEPNPEPKPEPEPEPVVANDNTESSAPSTPTVEEAEEPDDGFRRPEPRNLYTPTEEQLARRDRRVRRRWLWPVLAVAAVALLSWLFLHNSGDKTGASSPEVAMSDSIETALESTPAVITDTVTAKIVLSTLSDRYYDSPWFWVYIYEENKNIISDPNNVRPGTIVVIPPADKYGIDASDPESLKKAQRLSWEILKGK